MAKQSKTKQKRVRGASLVANLSDVVQDVSQLAASNVPPGFRVTARVGAYCCMLAHMANCYKFRSEALPEEIKILANPMTVLNWDMDTRIDESIGGLYVVLRGGGVGHERAKKLICHYVDQITDAIPEHQDPSLFPPLWNNVWAALQQRLKGETSKRYDLKPLESVEAMFAAMLERRGAPDVSARDAGVPSVARRGGSVRPTVSQPTSSEDDAEDDEAEDVPAPSVKKARKPKPVEKKDLATRAKEAVPGAFIGAVVGAATAKPGQRVAGAIKGGFGAAAAEVTAGEAAEHLSEELQDSDEKKNE